MKLITEQGFIKWAATIGIGFDLKYDPPRTLQYFPGCYDWLTWTRGSLGEFLLIEALLDAINASAYLRVWKTIPQWSYTQQTNGNPVWEALVHLDLVPHGYVGALEFGRDETDGLIRILFAQYVFGYSQFDDTYVVPDHGRMLLAVEHGGNIRVSSSDEAKLATVANVMARNGMPPEE